jgi:hypothetical protein
VACKGISLQTGKQNKDEKEYTVRGFFTKYYLYVQHPKGKKVKITYNFVSKN